MKIRTFLFAVVSFLVLACPAQAAGKPHSVFLEEDEKRGFRIDSLFMGGGPNARIAADWWAWFAPYYRPAVPKPAPASTGPAANDKYYLSSGTWGQSYADQWGLKKVNADDAWAKYTGKGAKIAIIDTGVDYRHADLDANIWHNPYEINGNGVDDDQNGLIDDYYGWNFYDWNSEIMDLNGHGTHVAGIAAAERNNSIGIAGIAPDAQIMGVRVLSRDGGGYFQDVADGIIYAAMMGADIINLSLGASGLDRYTVRYLQAAIDYAWRMGAVVVAAAGNNNGSADAFSPASLRNVISVGAVDSNDNRAWFSNYGYTLDVTAPGVDILSLQAEGTNIGGGVVASGYVRASGTSMAAPFVSGALALLIQKYPDASPSYLERMLKQGTVDLGARGIDSYYGYGRIDLAKMLGVADTIPYSSTSSSSATASSSSGAGSGTASASIAQSVTEVIEGIAAAVREMLASEPEEVSAEEIARANASLYGGIGRVGMAEREEGYQDPH